MRIAVCDDEQAIADLVGQLLVEAGFSPSVFYAAADLLAEQAGEPFDLVILDIMMPGMDGFACCRELRRTSSAPIIFLHGEGRGDRTRWWVSSWVPTTTW